MSGGSRGCYFCPERPREPWRREGLFLGNSVPCSDNGLSQAWRGQGVRREEVRVVFHEKA